MDLIDKFNSSHWGSFHWNRPRISWIKRKIDEIVSWIFHSCAVTTHLFWLSDGIDVSRSMMWYMPFDHWRFFCTWKVLIREALFLFIRRCTSVRNKTWFSLQHFFLFIFTTFFWYTGIYMLVGFPPVILKTLSLSWSVMQVNYVLKF